MLSVSVPSSRMRLLVYTSILFIFQNVLALKEPCPAITLRNGTVRIRAKGRIARFRCNRGFTLEGESNSAACIRGHWNLDVDPKCVYRSRCAPITEIPNGHVIPNKQWTMLRFICNSGYRLVGKSQLQCINSKWDGEPPYCRTSVQLICDFESKGICGWDNSTKSGYFWLKRQYATPSHSLNTGPGHDHTLQPQNDGHYLYIETSGLYGKDLKTTIARLYSPLFPPVDNNRTCFTFWYHMFGTTIGELMVYIDGHKVFHRAGSQGNRWIKGTVKNLPTDTFYQISIEGIPGNGWTGDLAIDDLNITTSDECTRPDMDDTTCDGRCYEEEAVNSTLCWCNEKCIAANNCCYDFFEVCNADLTTWAPSSPLVTENEITSQISEANTESSTEEKFSNTPVDFTQTSDMTITDLTETHQTYHQLTTEIISIHDNLVTHISLNLPSDNNNVSYTTEMDEASTQDFTESYTTDYYDVTSPSILQTDSISSQTDIGLKFSAQSREYSVQSTPLLTTGIVINSTSSAAVTHTTSEVPLEVESNEDSTDFSKSDISSRTQAPHTHLRNNSEGIPTRLEQATTILQVTRANSTVNTTLKTPTLHNRLTTNIIIKPRSNFTKPPVTSTTIGPRTSTRQISTTKMKSAITTPVTTKKSIITFRTVTSTTPYKSTVSSTISTVKKASATTLTKSKTVAIYFVPFINDSFESTQTTAIKNNQTTLQKSFTAPIKKTDKHTTVTMSTTFPISTSRETVNTENTRWKSKYKPKGYYRYSAIQQEQSDQGMANSVGIIVGVAVVFTSVVSIVFYYVYRRRSYLNTGGHNVEEADVLFIPTDEILDLTLSRPQYVSSNRKEAVNKV